LNLQWAATTVDEGLTTVESRFRGVNCCCIELVNEETEDVPNYYDVTIITVRPGTYPQAQPALKERLAGAPDFLACWFSDVGPLNQILVLRKVSDVAANLAARAAVMASPNPFGIGDLIINVSMDTYTAFDFLPPMRPGALGPCYEVRTYMLKPEGLSPTIQLWREWAHAAARSPLSSSP
jgi:hypothetical protein